MVNNLDFECKEKLKEIYTLAIEVLDIAPEEYECSDKLNDVFSEIANLKNSMEDIIDDLYKESTIKPSFKAMVTEAKNKRDNTISNDISLKEADYNFGIRVDKTYSIMLSGKEIGKCAITEMVNDEETRLEWLEFDLEYRGKSLLRPTLLAIGEHLNVKNIFLEASESNVGLYEHLGGSKTYYDKNREIQEFKLSVNDLKENIKENKNVIIR